MHKMQFFIYFIVINIILEDVLFWSDSSLNSIIGLPYQSLVFTKQIIGCYPLSKNKNITTYKAWIIIFDGFSCLFPLYFWCFRGGTLGRRSPRAHPLNPPLSKAKNVFFLL